MGLGSVPKEHFLPWVTGWVSAKCSLGDRNEVKGGLTVPWVTGMRLAPGNEVMGGSQEVIAREKGTLHRVNRYLMDNLLT